MDDGATRQNHNHPIKDTSAKIKAGQLPHQSADYGVAIPMVGL